MKSNTIHIKNMVCNRCIMVVTEVLKRMGFTPLSVELGTAILQEPINAEERATIKPVLEEYGFELIDDKRMRIIEQIKVAVIELVHYNDNSSKTNLSDYLTDKCHHDYSFLSKLFSEVNDISIERYYIFQKIERIKKLLVYDELSISEIAYKLNYSSAAHLSTQFRNITGISPSQFKRLKEHKLKPLDEV